MGLSEVLLLISAGLVLFFFWLKYNYAYWRRKNIASIDAHPIFGNLKDMILTKTSPADVMINFYNHKNAKDQPIVGIYVFNKPALLLRDLDVIKSILIKNFNKFCNRYSSCDSHIDPLGSYNLFFIKNPYWKQLRIKLTPVFTSGKMKQMFPLVQEIGKKLDDYLCKLSLSENGNTCIQEIKSISTLYTTDVIASVAYGVEANSLMNPACEFRTNGKSIFTFTKFRAFEFALVFFLPHLVKLFRIRFFQKSATNFIRDTINFVMAERIKTGVSRNDLIDILVSFKKVAESDVDKNHFALNNDMLVAQAAVFFSAGFETASSTISFGLYELSKRPELQKRLRAEIKEALTKCGGEITYEILSEMEYLNMIIQEVLRMYPPLPFLDRECTLSKDEKAISLKPYSDFSIPNKMPVYIPVYAIQRDPQYFPNPDEFDPERFSAENKANIVPLSYMPFGTGPHNCIGERLGLIQAKIGLINFLKNHFVTTCDMTPMKMVLEPKALIIQSKGGIYCKLVRDPLLV